MLTNFYYNDDLLFILTRGRINTIVKPNNCACEISKMRCYAMEMGRMLPYVHTNKKLVNSTIYTTYKISTFMLKNSIVTYGKMKQSM